MNDQYRGCFVLKLSNYNYSDSVGAEMARSGQINGRQITPDLFMICSSDSSS